MHSLTVDRGTILKKEKVNVVVPVTSVEVKVAGYKAMFALSFHTLSIKCLMMS